ncbi:MAG: Uncharacterized protein XE11_1815 [Methanomicrobiales archaeon 53_19]|uniref:DUF354 domain-containing protein n=1 Tax=Methanocalculus sp. TaxID=2004547 RepID=UPI000749DFC7|nr:DUF354 domain-containing protein [Methanocalculus sp.]KUK70031.1 MAG: Uncharacterized protein XD88_0908 [Methanocalculus sp. 52_23]KUL02318.1 MAG: Uncharacterized protein XE11_1815 [Methanomicrobiales archaeon 53_19]HIJ05876.1 DUF354 domain-containing protein [Methanocalculus sp.]
MRIIVDIGHPAHVHFFKNLIWDLEKKGHIIKITAVEKKDVFELLDAYNFEYTNMGSYNNRFKKLFSLISVNLKMLILAKKFKPDLFIGWGSPFVCHTSYFTKSKSILFLDNEPAIAHKICTPFADLICTSSAYSINYGKKHLKYNSYEPLAYLHPEFFNQDCNNDFSENKLEKKLNDCIILRFSAWDAIHDIGENGFNFENKEQLFKFISELEKYGSILISHEGNLDEDLKKYELKIQPEEYHFILSQAKLYAGEGASSAVEAALLGVPSIYISSLKLGFIDELEKKYDLIKTCNGHADAKVEAIRILENTESKNEIKRKRDRLIEEKENMTKWMIDLIERM